MPIRKIDTIIYNNAWASGYARSIMDILIEKINPCIENVPT